MKEITKYIMYISIGLFVLAGFINFLLVKTHNDKIVNDSLAKARKAKKAKAEERKERKDKMQEQIEKEVDEELFNAEIVDEVEIIKENIKQ